MDIGLRIGASIYDALYLALAVRDDSQLITDDRRLIQAARRDAQLRGRVHWIGDA
jgi:predicted nucleic acid-binding protein